MSNRDEQDSRLWVVDRIDLATGARERLTTRRDEAPVPYLADGGEVRWSLNAAAPVTDPAWLARVAAPGERLERLGGGAR